MRGPIGSEALIPNAALEPLAPLLGEWRTTGAHPLVPGTEFHGRTSFAWQEGGAFLLMRTEIDEPQIPSAVAIFGSDDEAGTLFMLYFDERGVSRKYDVTSVGDTVTWRRDHPAFAQRMTLTLDAAGGRIDARGEMSRGGGAWEGDLALTYVRMAD